MNATEHPNRPEYIRRINKALHFIDEHLDHDLSLETVAAVACYSKKWIAMNVKIEIKETPEMKLASITQIGVVGMEKAFERLIRWANPKGLMENPEAKLARVFQDSFKVTAPDKVRMTIGLITDEPFEAKGEIHETVLKPSRCIVGRFEITPDEFEKAWSGLFIWMNEKGYSKAEANPFEIYHNDFRRHPEGKCVVDLYIPIN